MKTRLSIVVPVFNAQRYIAQTVAELVDWLANFGPNGEIVVIDDGSTDGSVAAIRRAFLAANPAVTKRLLENGENRGKGYALRRGLLAARGDWRIFIDADLAYPVVEIERMLVALEAGADLAVASRVRNGSRYMMSSEYFRHIFFRHSIGRLFNAIARATVLDEILDTQAGLKAMTADVAKSLLPRLRLEGFSFDVELLFLAQRSGFRIEEVPVTFVYTGGPSTLALGRDGLKMLLDLARIRLFEAWGHYDREPVAPESEPGARGFDATSSE